MPDPTTVFGLIREAARLLLLAKRDRHAEPAVAELDAAVYLLNRALGQIEFDTATAPEPHKPAWRIMVEPPDTSYWVAGPAGFVPSGLAADAEAALDWWWSHNPEWARPPFGRTFRAEPAEVAP